MDCLNSLIGLSATVPKCFTGSAPSGYSDSTSGYYVNDSDYGMRVMEGCQLDGWALLSEAKEIGIRNFKTDLRSKLYDTFQTAFTPFSGLIGRTANSGPDVNFSRPYGGQRVRVDGVSRDMYLVIKAIYLGVNTTGAYTVTVTSNDPDFEAQTYTLSGTGGSYQRNNLSEELLLPMYSKHFCDNPDEYLTYYLQVEYDGAKPLNGNFTCCGNKPGWMQFAEVDGFGASNEERDFLEFSSSNRGLALDAYLKCNDLDWLCSLSELAGFQTLDVAARAIQFRAGIAAYGLLLDRGHLNVCTMYNLESINAHRNFLQTKYAEYLTWIVENVPTGATSCIKCKAADVFTKAKSLL